VEESNLIKSIKMKSLPAVSWTDVEITVDLQQEKERRYTLHRPDGHDVKGRIPHSTLVSSYLATAKGQRATVPEFILKLPECHGLSDADWNARVEQAQEALKFERDLRLRLIPETIASLPKLIVDPAAGHFLEFTSPPQQQAKTHTIPYLAYQHVEGVSLRKWILQESGERFDGIENQKDWFSLARRLFRSLEELHRQRVTHGFVCPDTIIIPPRTKTIDDTTLIQFINAAGSQKRVCVPLPETGKLQSLERDEFRPVRRWYDANENIYHLELKQPYTKYLTYVLSDDASNYHSTTDIFSLGVTLAFLATGREDVVCPFDYAEPWSLAKPGWEILYHEQKRKHYHVMKAELIDALMSAAKRRRRGGGDECQEYQDSLRRAEVILQCVRSKVDRRARNVAHALTILNLFAHPEDTRRVLPDIPKTKLKPKKVQSFESLLASRLPAHVPSALWAVLLSQVESMEDRAHSLREQGAVRIIGGRSALVDAFLNAVSTLTRDDICVAVTTPAIWSDDNFGPTSRISSMLQLVRLRGVGMRWVFKIRERDRNTGDVQRILAFRHADEEKLRAIYRPIPESEGFFYETVDDKAYEEFVRTKKFFIGFLSRQKYNDLQVRGPEQMSLDLLIAPDFMVRAGPLAALTFWMRSKRTDLLEVLQSVREAASVIPSERSGA
jgi:serine/threonine protein kinase